MSIVLLSLCLDPSFLSNLRAKTKLWCAYNKNMCVQLCHYLFFSMYCIELTDSFFIHIYCSFRKMQLAFMQFSFNTLYGLCWYMIERLIVYEWYNNVCWIWIKQNGLEYRLFWIGIKKKELLSALVKIKK